MLLLNRVKVELDCFLFIIVVTAAVVASEIIVGVGVSTTFCAEVSAITAVAGATADATFAAPANDTSVFTSNGAEDMPATTVGNN